MEETKQTCGDGAEMEARFDRLVKGLALERSMEKEVMDLYLQCKPLLIANLSTLGSGSPEEIERHWSAFVLYCITKLRSGDGGNENEKSGVSLSQILKATKLSVVDFFREMPQLLLKSGQVLSRIYSPDWERRLEVKEAQANFVHLRLLSSYYRRAYEEFFLPSSENGGKDNTEHMCAGFVSECHRFGWLLFLALRIHAFNRLKDLVSCTNGLVSILAILIIHVPFRLRRFPFADSTRFVKKTDKGIDLLASLCEIYHTSEDDLRVAMEKANSLIVDILKKTPRPASEFQTENLSGFSTDGLTYFEDLMEQGSLCSSLLFLENDYDNAVHTKGELDERIFVNDEDSLLGTGSLSGGAMYLSGTKRKFDALASPCKSITSPLTPPHSPVSPSNGKNFGSSRVAATPVSTAMTTAKWLRTIISPLSSKPSAELELFLSSCSKNVADDVPHRANIILEAIFPCRSPADRSISGSLQNVTLMDGVWAGERKMEAMKLYYRVLEAICRAESHVLCASNLSSLLSNERFHRCMLACAAELVLATHKTVSMMFPAVLERTGITAFDLSKVIECFVRHEETLPRELKRHLNSLEERLLESLAWEKGSSMYSSLVVARPALSEEISRLGLLADPMPSLDSIAFSHNILHGSSPPQKTNEMLPDLNGEICSPTRVMPNLRCALLERNSFKSPVKNTSAPFGSPKSKLPPLQSAFATPTRLNPSRGETCAETGICVFFSKIVKLAAVRIKSLCEKLQLQQQILEHVYALVQQIVNQKTFLLFNRHIDQIILCSLYGVAKISQLSLTFKEIINCYRKQPQCKPQVFRSVFVDWPSNSHNGKKGQEYVDIITFYNGVFIPSVKPLLVEFGPAGSASKNNRVSEVNTFEGRCPGSPRLSQFPTLPDMSPKKVSATHNVYVSPLRSSKMDALLSPSSKSYYACVGESTHAYQSPSKDLTVINNRINSGRKLRLNFDMVSDSLVVGSLSSQNGTTVSSSTTSMITRSVKCKQPDF